MWKNWIQDEINGSVNIIFEKWLEGFGRTAHTHTTHRIGSTQFNDARPIQRTHTYTQFHKHFLPVICSINFHCSCQLIHTIFAISTFENKKKSFSLAIKQFLVPFFYYLATLIRSSVSTITKQWNELNWIETNKNQPTNCVHLIFRLHFCW